MSSLECPVVPAGTGFSLTPAKKATVTDSGALEFTADVHAYCGHCLELSLLCNCCGENKERKDAVFCCLPPPELNQETSTERLTHLLSRWASLVENNKAMKLDSSKFVECEGPKLVATLSEGRKRMEELVDSYIPVIPKSTQFSSFVNALGFFPQQVEYPELQGNPQKWIEVLSNEVRTAAIAYCEGDWSCITVLGLLLLNDAFLNSDPKDFPHDEVLLQELYKGLKLLVKLSTDAFSPQAVRYALEMDRTKSIIEKEFRERREMIKNAKLKQGN